VDGLKYLQQLFMLFVTLRRGLSLGLILGCLGGYSVALLCNGGTQLRLVQSNSKCLQLALQLCTLCTAGLALAQSRGFQLAYGCLEGVTLTLQSLTVLCE